MTKPQPEIYEEILAVLTDIPVNGASVYKALQGRYTRQHVRRSLIGMVRKKMIYAEKQRHGVVSCRTVYSKLPERGIE